jgi:Ricin-type beta-trefoil lectin domain
MRTLKVARRWQVIGGMVAVLALSAALVLPSLRTAPAAAAGGVMLKNLQTGLCLSANSSNAAYPANGLVYTFQCTGSDYQKWSFTYLPGNTVTLTNAQFGACLETNSTGAVFTEGCTGGAAQEWAYNIVSNGSLGLCNVYFTGLCLDSNVASQVYAIQGNGDTNQNWVIAPS